MKELVYVQNLERDELKFFLIASDYKIIHVQVTEI